MKKDIEISKCLNGHEMKQDEYICWKCGSHCETDIQKWIKIKKRRKQ